MQWTLDNISVENLSDILYSSMQKIVSLYNELVTTLTRKIAELTISFNFADTMVFKIPTAAIYVPSTTTFRVFILYGIHKMDKQLQKD